jgi:hypothetical protein
MLLDTWLAFPMSEQSPTTIDGLDPRKQPCGSWIQRTTAWVLRSSQQRLMGWNNLADDVLESYIENI